MLNSATLKTTPDHPDRFADRHIGPRAADVARMLSALGCASLDALIDAAVPAGIRMKKPLDLPPAMSEAGILRDLSALAGANRVARSYLGLGYHGTITPAVLRRNVLENPGWYTQYTPYQAEIAQGRLEALLIFQTMVMDLTGLEVANASMLDEGTAAAEAMTLCRRVLDRKAPGEVFFVSKRCHPQTIAVVEARAHPLGLRVVVGDETDLPQDGGVFGVLLQYPASDGEVPDYQPVIAQAHAAGALVAVAADLLSLTLLRSPGELGADVAVGSTQRFGVPLFYGGPHAGYIATRDEYKRQLPGRIVGVSRDAAGEPAIRLALQTREQHIRRDKATSNICTAQVLLAVLAAMYAVYHGPEGLRAIAARVRRQTLALAASLQGSGWSLRHDTVFDTLRAGGGPRTQRQVLDAAAARGINLRAFDDGDIGVTLDETVGAGDLADLAQAFGAAAVSDPGESPVPGPHARGTEYLTHEVFQTHRSETGMLRYLHSLEERDLSLNTAMIPLGSCTMKLNAAAEMEPVSLPGFASIHPFAPVSDTPGYAELFRRLERMLAEITGFDAVSLMPNAGSQGEYAGLLVIRAWHASRGESARDICLIPVSAHGTNPASAVMAGLHVVPVACDASGNVEIVDLEQKIGAHPGRIAALMVTYPSTHGVFEEGIREICERVHAAGGQVYLDGANMNALVGLCRPGDFGADVCHLNLHKTFCIPHGGGGPGAGPIGVAKHLAPFLPTHPLVSPVPPGGRPIGPVAAAPWGSAGIFPISYAYIAMMGPDGLRRASAMAILNANYTARRLEPHYPILYKGLSGFVAHECIVDTRGFKATAGVDVDDIAKRLIDYGFHAPTMSWPVAGTLMIEPTESEPLDELDRFIEAMIAIREEIREIESGRADAKVNLLKMAPHTARAVASDDWGRPYSRERAAFPTEWTRRRKFWPAVARVDNAWGDRNLACACAPVAAYAEPPST